MQDKSILPVSGGFCEQSAQFIKACDFVEQYAAATKSFQAKK
jgi:hypothetical protein